MIPFSERPTVKSQECPKCDRLVRWKPTYCRRDRVLGYDQAEAEVPDEFLAWSCGSCGYRILTQTADAERHASPV